MTVQTPDVVRESQSHDLTPQKALRLARILWVCLLLLPYALLPIVLRAALSADASSAKPEVAERWFLTIMLYLLIALPVALAWRGQLFKAYWRGEVVSPRRYLQGMVTVWVALAIGGAAAQVACSLTRTVVPNVVPALLALFVYLVLWPDGSAMTSAVGGTDDPEVYREPH